MVIKIVGQSAAPIASKGFSARKVEALKKQVEKTGSVKEVEAADGKIAISIRLDREVLAFFKANGPGWQSRINVALRGVAGLGNPVENPGEGE